MEISRTKFKREIVCEFARPKHQSNKVIIIATGMPSYPKKNEIFEKLVEAGFWIFIPRYRGSWESEGKMFKKSPHIDIKDVIDSLDKPFVDLWSKQKIVLKTSKIYLLGYSFGGPAVLLNASHPKVKKVVAISSVIDWTNPGKDEPLDKLYDFLKEGWTNGYRFDKKYWNKLEKGNFFNPIKEVNNIPKEKVLLIHAKDDGVCYFDDAKKFSEQNGCKMIALNEGDHICTDALLDPYVWKKFREFFK